MPRGGKFRHPWAQWKLLKRFTLVRGVDYSCADHGMAQQLRNYALRNGREVSLAVGDGRVEVFWRERRSTARRGDA